MHRTTLPLLLALAPLPLLGAGTFLNAPVRDTATVKEYLRADFHADVAASFTDPFDQRVIAVDLLLTAPSGRTITLPTYYDSGDATDSVWRARFAAQELGTYHYTFRLTEAGTVTATSADQTFEVVASDSDGFIHPNNAWSFVTDSGKAFRGLGENVGWESRTWEDASYTYDLFLPELANNGASFFRTWSGAWNLPLEWKKVVDTNRYSNTTATYNPGGVKRLDELVALCESLHLRFMLCLDQHGGFMTSGQWASNNYNVVNGGPCAKPADFFTNAEAKARYKNRLRYLVARWGYSTSIGAWELFNEIDNAAFDDTAKIPTDTITSWHTEMSAYLKQLDPYGHLVTTSVSWRDIPGLYDVPSIDFNQRHTYNNTATIPTVISTYLNANKKPFVDGEFAWDWDWNHVTTANGPYFDYDLKFGLWYGLFSPTPIVPMTWWWEFFHERGMIPYLSGVRTISDKMLAAGNGQFTTLASNGHGLHAMAVAAGHTVFVHAHNTGTAAATADVTITVNATTPYTLQTFDPETRTLTTADAKLTPVNGNVTLSAVSLASHEQRVFVLIPPTAIVTPPAAVGASVGGRATFSVSADNAISYQWSKDGTDIPGATKPLLTVQNVQASDAGAYHCTVTGLVGSAITTADASLTLVPAGTLRVVNISTRAHVGTGAGVLIGGFIIGGSTPKKVVIRASGPALAAWGLGDVLADPVLELYSGQTVIARNDDWDAADAPDFKAVNAFDWTPGSKDAAIVTTLDPGSYTAQVSGKDGTTGLALVEVYDEDPSPSASELTNISTRSPVGTGANVQIAGFNITGTAPKRVVIRATGPGLTQYGLAGVLADPVLELYSGQTLLARNDDWDASAKGDFDLIKAFPWDSGSKDAAIVVTLPPGGYTAQVSGKDAAGGIAIVEVYEEN